MIRHAIAYILLSIGSIVVGTAVAIILLNILELV